MTWKFGGVKRKEEEKGRKNEERHKRIMKMKKKGMITENEL